MTYKKLRNFLIKEKIDYFILPNSDEFFLEYLPNHEKRIEFISGFSGSAASIVFCTKQKKSQFFTDGRYILQAKNQLNLANYDVVNIIENPILQWFENNLKKSQKIAIDTKLSSIEFVEKLQKIAKNKVCEIIFLSQNPVDKIWQDRPKKLPSKIYDLPLKYVGIDSKTKISNIIKNLKTDAMLLSNSESICWLLNIRASDVEFSPLLASYAMVYKSGEVSVGAIHELPLQNPIKSIELDPSQTNYAIYKSFLDKKIKIIKAKNPILAKKAIKNKTEIKNAIKAHKIDGLAVTKFLFWLDNAVKNGEKIDEIHAEKKLLEFRQENKEFLYPSFATISSYASNGAVIHYHATKETNKKIIGNSLYLIDSGGQYFLGTTDITRTVAIGTPTAEMIENFTLVLKGHIALAQAEFSNKTTGLELDKLARQFLKKAGKDYAHGTGHGVGSFLSVHESPPAISPRAIKQRFKAGMIVSNEPGFYKENEYGIRIENLVLVNKIKDKLTFKTLTLAPIDYRLLNKKMLTAKEKNWLKNYHKKVFATHESHLDDAQKSWLSAFCEF